MSALLSFLGNKEESVLLIDIGNGNVSTAVGVFNRNRTPELYATKIQPFGVTEKVDSSLLIENLVKLLDGCIAETLKEAFVTGVVKVKDKKIARVVISFSAPWYVFKTKHVTQTETRPFLIHKAYLNNLILREQKLFKEELAKLYPGTVESFSISETSIVHTKINGYDVENALNKTTNTFDAYVCMSAIPDQIATRVINAVVSHTHISREKILTHTFPVVSFSVIREHFAKEEDYLLVDVTGETTDIINVTNGMITGTASFPCGRHAVIRHIAQNQKVTLEIAESNLNMFLQNAVEPGVVTSLQGAIENIEKEFAVYLEDALSSLSPKYVLPRKVFVTANSDTAQLFVNFLKMQKPGNLSDWRRNADVVYLGGKELAEFSANMSKGPSDEFVAMLAVFYLSLLRNQ